MSRGLLCCVGCLAIVSALSAEEPKEVKTIARIVESYGPVQFKGVDTGVVIRNAEELVAHSLKPDAAKDVTVQKEQVAALAKMLKVESIDWKTQMIVAFGGHGTGDGGGIIKFGPLKIEDKVLIVPWEQEDRPSLGIITPKGVILVERFDGEVKFVRLPKK